MKREYAGIIKSYDHIVVGREKVFDRKVRKFMQEESNEGLHPSFGEKTPLRG